MPNSMGWMSPQRRKVIAAKARYMQLSLLNAYHKRNGTQPDDPLDVVSPVAGLESLGFQVVQQDLGQDLIDGRMFEVAGYIDAPNKVVALSTKISREEQFFTAAHELGHAVLHPGQDGLHRDRPVKGPSARKDLKEAEADYFASCFLMPEKLLRRYFKWKFLCETFELNNETAYALAGTNVSSLRSQIKSKRELSRILAECISFNGNRDASLKSAFQVSTEAMAIQLEDLGLVRF